MDFKRRKPNWGANESKALTEAVMERAGILFGKLTPSITSEKKKMVWEEVAERVNAVNVSSFSRTVDEVKKRWKDTKAVVKRKEAERKRNIATTGGGSSEDADMKPWEIDVLSLIPKESIEGLQGGVDTAAAESQNISTQSGDEETSLAEGPLKTLIPEKFHQFISTDLLESIVCSDEKSSHEFREKNNCSDITVYVYNKRKPLYSTVRQNLNGIGEDAVKMIDKHWIINLLCDWGDFDEIICQKRSKYEFQTQDFSMEKDLPTNHIEAALPVTNPAQSNATEVEVRETVIEIQADNYVEDNMQTQSRSKRRQERKSSSDDPMYHLIDVKEKKCCLEERILLVEEKKAEKMERQAIAEERRAAAEERIANALERILDHTQSPNQEFSIAPILKC